MKKILINALLLNNRYSGVQYSIEYFIKALSQTKTDGYKFTVLVSKNYKGSITESINTRIHKVSFNSSNRVARIFYENFNLSKFFYREGYDLYHSPGYILPYFSSMPTIVTIHDLIALRYPKLCKNETAIYYNLFLPRTIYQSKKIIAVSNSVKKDILHKFPMIYEGKVNVAYHGLHARFMKIKDCKQIRTVVKKYLLPASYLLFIGNIEPKKNLKLVIDAFTTLKREHCLTQKLVLVGQKGWKCSDVFNSINNANLENEIRYLGYIDEDDLPVLYSLADIFLFPSLYEGFGLPVLEAMACECPVIVSDRGALPELSGGFCQQVNPYSTIEIVTCILKILRNERYKADLIKQGKVWSKLFTWDKSVESVLTAYEEVIQS